MPEASNRFVWLKSFYEAERGIATIAQNINHIPLPLRTYSKPKGGYGDYVRIKGKRAIITYSRLKDFLTGAGHSKAAKLRAEGGEQAIPYRTASGEAMAPKLHLMAEIKRARRYFEEHRDDAASRASTLVYSHPTDRHRSITRKAHYIRSHWEELISKALGMPNKSLEEMRAQDPDSVDATRHGAYLDWDEWKAAKDFERALHGETSPILKVLGESKRYGGERAALPGRLLPAE